MPFEGVQRPIEHVVGNSWRLRDGSSYSVMCPTCGANPWHWCVTRGGLIRELAHQSRVDKADEA